MERRQRVSKMDLARSLGDAGYISSSFLVNKEQANKGTDDSLVKGELCFGQLPSGLSLHCTDAVELVTGKSTAELDPSININVLLSGSVEFALGEEHYQFSAKTKPLIFVNVIGERQLFRRFFKQGTEVKKLCVSTRRDWLLARCTSQQDRHKVAGLFSACHRVYQLPCQSHWVRLAKMLFATHHCHNISAKIKAEQLAFELFGSCFLEVDEMYQSEPVNIQPTAREGVGNEQNFEKRLAELSYENLTLSQLSDHLGASISTLQRYFKANYQLTLKEYMRNQKLEHARRLLIFERQSIGEVAFWAGYNHPSNFVTAFKNHFQITPAQLQKQYCQTRIFSCT